MQGLTHISRINRLRLQSGLFRKGKLRPLKKLQSSPFYQEAFGNLSNTVVDDLEDIFEKLEKFVCEMYGLKETKKQPDLNVIKARYDLFLKNYKIKDVNEAFEKKKIKKFDASTIPPCAAELKQQLLRTYYISKLWCNANEKIPLAYGDDQLEPTEYGWIINENQQLTYKWFDGPQVPESVREIVDESDGKHIKINFLISSFNYF